MFKFKSKNKNKVDKKAATKQLILAEQSNQNLNDTTNPTKTTAKNEKQGRKFYNFFQIN